MSEQRQRQKIEFAVRRFLKRVIRNGGQIPNVQHPVIDSDVYRLLSTELSRQVDRPQEEKLSVDQICDRLIPLINSRNDQSPIRRLQGSAETVTFDSQRHVAETIRV